MKHAITYILPALMISASCSSTPDYDATGIFEATTVTLSAETSGKILNLGVAEGDTVRAGQTVAVVDTAILSLQLLQLESQKLSADARE